MAIDVTTPETPGYWLNVGYKGLRARQGRLQDLWNRYSGDAPLPAASPNVRAAYKEFQKKARTNWYELTVRGPANRMKVTGFRTAQGADKADDVAWQVWSANGMGVQFLECVEMALAMSEASIMVGPVQDDTGMPLVTVEDPRQVITIGNPANPRDLYAGVKVFHDPHTSRDLAYVYLKGGEVQVAYNNVTKPDFSGGRRITFTPATWNWDEALAGKLNHGRVPIATYRPRRGLGLFESHIDLFDRIDHIVLSRLVIAAMQAYRQRAIKGAPTEDEHGNVINYEELFSADPGALWDLPEGVELWESAQTDLTPVLSAAKADIEALAAVMQMPLSHFLPSAQPQTAEGAALAREGLVFLTEDLIATATETLKDVQQLAFLTLEDTERADRSKLDVIWRPPERSSLSERADAASKAQDIPWRTRMSEIWGFSEQDIDRMEAERAADALIAASHAAVAASTIPQPVSPPPAPGPAPAA